MPPVFLLSMERSGSTLLRLILDAHAEIWCPDEIHVGRLCDALVLTLGGANDAVTGADTVADTRRIVDEMLEGAAARHDKRLWCDKSPSNLEHLAILERVFPDAHWICLYRHCFDVVASALDACRHGFWPGLAAWAARRPDDLVQAMTEAWLDKNEAIAALEARHPGSSCRIRYEDLVTQPEGVLAAVAATLGVAADREWLARTFAQPRHYRPGHGDDRAAFSTRVESDRRGRGAALPWRALPPGLLQRVTDRLLALGYPALDAATDSYPLGAPAPSPAEDRAVPPDVATARLLEQRLPEAARRFPELAAGLRSRYQVEITGQEGGGWLLDFTSGKLRVERGGRGSCVFAMSAADLRGIAEGELNAHEAWSQGRVRVFGEVPREDVATLVQLLAAKMS